MAIYEILAFFLSPLVAFLEPYMNQLKLAITSPTLFRRLIKILVSVVIVLLLVSASLVAYLGFYWYYIPQSGHLGQVYFQYPSKIGTTVGTAFSSGPRAEVDFTNGGRYTQFLRSDQTYDISVQLAVPTSDNNIEIGNFMVEVTLLNADGKVVQSSARPAILTYQSGTLRLMKLAWKAVPLVLDFSREAQVLKVPIIENFVENSANPVSMAVVQISNPSLHIYKSTIHIDAQFRGLRYFMYYFKVPTALLFMAIFIFWELVASVATWHMLSGWFGTNNGVNNAQQLTEHHLQQYNNQNEDGIANLLLTEGDGHGGRRSGRRGRDQGGATGMGTGTGGAGGQGGSTLHQLRAPTAYQQSGNKPTPQPQLQTLTPTPRQPQLQSRESFTMESDEDNEMLLGGRRGGNDYDHDEMDDEEEYRRRQGGQYDDEDDDEEENREDRDDGVVPEHEYSAEQQQRLYGKSTSSRLQQQQQQGSTSWSQGDSSLRQRQGYSESHVGVDPSPELSFLTERGSGSSHRKKKIMQVGGEDDEEGNETERGGAGAVGSTSGGTSRQQQPHQTGRGSSSSSIQQAPPPPPTPLMRRESMTGTTEDEYLNEEEEEVAAQGGDEEEEEEEEDDENDAISFDENDFGGSPILEGASTVPTAGVPSTSTTTTTAQRQKRPTTAMTAGETSSSEAIGQ